MVMRYRAACRPGGWGKRCDGWECHAPAAPSTKGAVIAAAMRVTTTALTRQYRPGGHRPWRGLRNDGEPQRWQYPSWGMQGAAIDAWYRNGGKNQYFAAYAA
jgi:hypothetical protein